jgi:hypothetical protein
MSCACPATSLGSIGGGEEGRVEAEEEKEAAGQREKERDKPGGESEASEQSKKAADGRSDKAKQ